MPDLMRGLRSPIPDQRCRAARAIGRLGPLARDAMPLLTQAVDDAEQPVREAATQAIGQMGPDAIPLLRQTLVHPDKYVRRHSVWALAKLCPSALVALPNLCQALKDVDPRTASGAAQALANLGPSAAEAIPALTEAMRGTNIVLCRLAAKALSQIGRPALPSLIAHLQHRDTFVRGEAALALGWIGADAAVAVPVLIDLLKGRRPGPTSTPTSQDSATPVTAVTATPPPVSPEDNSIAYAAQALGRIGPAAAAAIPVLEQISADPSEQICQSAAQALRQIRGA